MGGGSERVKKFWRGAVDRYSDKAHATSQESRVSLRPIGEALSRIRQKAKNLLIGTEPLERDPSFQARIGPTTHIEATPRVDAAAPVSTAADRPPRTQVTESK